VGPIFLRIAVLNFYSTRSQVLAAQVPLTSYYDASGSSYLRVDAAVHTIHNITPQRIKRHGGEDAAARLCRPGDSPELAQILERIHHRRRRRLPTTLPQRQGPIPSHLQAAGS
jgi:hypothetical protein